MVKSVIMLFMCLLSLTVHSQCIVGNCEEGYGEQKYSSGQRYEGQFSGGKRNGKGTYYFPSGTKYIGDFQNGNYHGRGRLISSSGSVYEGEFKYDKKHGLGTEYGTAGEVIFAGEYNNDLRLTNSSSLPNSILADKYLLEAKKLMESGAYHAAIVSFNKILALKVTPPNEFFYYLGKCHYSASNYKRCIDQLVTYVKNSGKNGEYYVKSLEIISNAEAKVNKESMDVSEKKNQVANCTQCSGSGYYYTTVRCSSCSGSGKSYPYCDQCGGNGQSRNRCTSCGGTGMTSYVRSDGGYNHYDCSYCINGWANCYTCSGKGKLQDYCGTCAGRGTVSQKNKCYKH